MIIALDAMGGDYAPREIVKGAIEAIGLYGVEIILVGDRTVLERELETLGVSPGKVQVHHASQVVDMHEHAAAALRKKKDSSIVVATSLVAGKQADAVVSCGNTGAQMAAAMFLLGRFDGVDRPAIAAMIPSGHGITALVDVGANVDAKQDQMVQFARMGAAYYRNVMGVDNPRVVLLSNGTEDTKGNQVVQAVNALLREDSEVNFAGNIEGRDLFSGIADVVVCDGFVGNVVLKTIEGLTAMIVGRLKDSPGAGEAFADLDYTAVGGAPLLGVRGISVVCHGSSKSKAVVNGIKVAQQCVQGGLASSLEQALGLKRS